MTLGDTDSASKLQDLLGFEDTTRLWLGGLNESVKRRLLRQLKVTHLTAHEVIDVAILTPQSIDEANYFAQKIRPRLTQNSVLWIVLGMKETDSQHQPHESTCQWSAALTTMGYQSGDIFTWDEKLLVLRFVLPQPN